MRFKLVRLEIHLGLKHNKLLVQTVLLHTEVVIFSKVNFERVVVDIVLLLPAGVPSIADMAALVPVSAVRIQLIVTIEALLAKSALRMPSETALVHCAGVVVPKLLMLSQLGVGEQLVLVRKDLFVACAEITKTPSENARPRVGGDVGATYHMTL